MVNATGVPSRIQVPKVAELATLVQDVTTDGNVWLAVSKEANDNQAKQQKFGRQGWVFVSDRDGSAKLENALFICSLSAHLSEQKIVVLFEPSGLVEIDTQQLVPEVVRACVVALGDEGLYLVLYRSASIQKYANSHYFEHLTFPDAAQVTGEHCLRQTALARVMSNDTHLK